MDQRRAVFWRRPRGGVAVQGRRLPGVREVAQGPQGARADRRGHPPLPARGGQPARDDPPDGGGGSGHPQVAGGVSFCGTLLLKPPLKPGR